MSGAEQSATNAVRSAGVQPAAAGAASIPAQLPVVYIRAHGGYPVSAPPGGQPTSLLVGGSAARSAVVPGGVRPCG
ncbi:hypothetical protein [Mycolicibacterium grossiae]|uniref:hypothetical protein n=1 Tax=Mycolicibacterium grossiae TaxID=1552759 RepID=UPI0014781200|nr:hypothetical protein [Mycolicibacterium grossiae]